MNIAKNEKSETAKFLRKIPLEKFIPAAFVVFLLFLFILSLITFSNIGLYKNDLEWAIHTQEVIQANENLMNTVIELSFIRKGYLITGDDKYIDRFNKIKNRYYEQADTLQKLVKDNPEQSARIHTLDSLCQENNSLLRESMVLYKKEKKINDVQLEETYKVENDLEKIKTHMQVIKKEENRLLDERIQRVNSYGTNIQLFILVTSITAFFVIGVSIFIARKLIQDKSDAESLIRESYEKLESRIQSRTAELRNTNDKLKEEISNREKFEHTLKESEQRFRILADSSPSLIWMSGVDGKAYYFNKTWYDFTGLTEGVEYEQWIKKYHPSELKKNTAYYYNLLKKRKKHEFEYRLMRNDGEYRWIYDIAIPRFIGNEFQGYIGAGIDITDRKRNERYLYTQYEVSRIFDSIPSLDKALPKVLQAICESIEWDFSNYWLVDKENNRLKLIEKWGNQYEILKDYDKYFVDNYGLIKGQGVPGFVYETKKYYYCEDIQKDELTNMKDPLIEMGVKSFFSVPIIVNNEVIAIMVLFSMNYSPFSKEMVEMVLSISTQVASFMERKRSETELQQSHVQLEQKVQERTMELASALNKLLDEIDEKEKVQARIKLFAHAVKDISEGIFITDLNNKIIFVNKAFEEISGYTSEELLNNELPVLFSENAVLIDEREKGRTAVPLRDWKGNIYTKRKDGTSFYMHLSASTIRDEEGQAEAYIQVCQDVTESKEKENLIIKRNNLLKLLNEIIILTNKSDDVDNVISQSVIHICNYTGWEIGHCFLLNKEEILEPTGLWNSNNAEYDKIKTETSKQIFRKGEGLPGRILSEGKSFWVKFDDINNSGEFKRINMIYEYGFKTVIWAPILSQEKAVGVLEFFNREKQEPDYEILDCITNIGIEIGSMFERVDNNAKLIEKEKSLKVAQHVAKLGSWEYNVLSQEFEISDELYEIFELNGPFDKKIESLFKYFPQEDKDSGMRYLKMAIQEKKPYNHIVRFQSPNSGKTKYLRVEADIVLDNFDNVIKVIGTNLDITEIKESEEKLLNSERQLKLAQKLSKLGSFESNFLSGEQIWSDELYRIFDFIPGEIEPNFISIRKYINKHDINKLNILSKKANVNTNSDKADFRIITHKGEFKNLHIEVFSEYDENQTPVRIFGSVQDVTHIRKIEEELRRANLKLIKAQNELINSEKLAALGRFSAGIAHEIRNPLTNISTLSQLLLKAKLDEKSRKHLKYINVNVDIANRVIKNLLSFASPDDLMLNKENISNILEYVIFSLETRCSENQIIIHKNIGTNLPELYVDKTKLENALLNFSYNAIDAMKGGGSLTYRLYYNKDSNDIVIHINDTGIGIAKENLDKIFEPFFTTKKEGIGLGLGLAYQTIKLHHGDITIKSEPGKGTDIKIVLPSFDKEENIIENGKNINN